MGIVEDKKRKYGGGSRKNVFENILKFFKQMIDNILKNKVSIKLIRF